MRGLPDVADCYGVELLRLYEHYRFRWHAKQSGKATRSALSPDDRWTKPYFEDDSLEAADRRRFGAAMN
jgi:hypothetical protein